MEEQQQRATEPRAVARRVPGLEGVEGKLRLEIEGKPPRVLAIHDGLIEPLQQADEQVDATIVFDSESCLDELLAGKLNPIVAGLQSRMLVTGDLRLVIRVIFELQGQAGGFGRPIVGEA